MTRPGRLAYPFVQAHPSNYGQGRQGYNDVWFVMHCTDDAYSDNYPANLGHYWSTNAVSVSVHFCVSDTQCYQYVDMNDCAFQARNPGNLRGVGVELSGLKSWGRNDWLAHRMMIRRAATLCAQVAAVRGYRVGNVASRLGRDDLGARRSGVTQHADLTVQFGGTHTDLGTEFPWDLFWVELHKAYQPLAAQHASSAASAAAAHQQAAEEEAMAVSDAEFADLKRKVDQIHGVLVSGATYQHSNLQTQLGYIVGKIVRIADRPSPPTAGPGAPD